MVCPIYFHGVRGRMYGCWGEEAEEEKEDDDNDDEESKKIP